MGAGEALPATECSAYTLANAVSSAALGCFYPIGGPAALIDCLSRTVRKAGGFVYRDVDVKEVVLEEINSASATGQIKATGVIICAGNGKPSSSSSRKQTIVASENKKNKMNEEITKNESKKENVDDEDGNSGEEEEEGQGQDQEEDESKRGEEIVLQASKSVISGLGVLSTYTKLIPAEAVSRPTRDILSGLKECRPKTLVVYWLQGSEQDMGAALRSCDYYEVGVQPESDSAESKESKDVFCSSFVHVWSPSAKDPSWAKK